MADHIVRPIIRSIIRPIIRALTAPAGGGSAVDPAIPLGLLSKLRGWYGLQDSYADEWGAWPLVDISSGAGSFADASAFGSGLAGRCLTGSLARTRVNVPNYGTGKSFFIGALRSTNAFTANQFTAFMGKAAFNDSLALSEHAAGFQSRGVLDSAGPATYLANAASSANTWHLTIAQHSAAGTVRNHQDTTLNAATNAGNANLNPTDFLAMGSPSGLSQAAAAANLFWGEGEITQEELDYIYNNGAGRTIAEIISDAGYIRPSVRIDSVVATLEGFASSYDGRWLANTNASTNDCYNTTNNSLSTGKRWAAFRITQTLDAARSNAVWFEGDAASRGQINISGPSAGTPFVFGVFSNVNSPAATVSPSGVSEDVYMMAIDMDARKVWYGKNGTWSGNPSAGTGEAQSYTATDPISIGMYSDDASFGSQWGFVTGEMPYSNPTGFTPWGDA